jgi:serine protease Do
VRGVDPGMATSLGLPPGAGVLIEDIALTSPARGSGLRAGDIILEVGSETVISAEQFSALLSRYNRGDVLRLRVRRGNSWVFIAFTV